MAENTFSDQGTIVPTLFIGLGGVGSRMVDRIAKRAGFLPDWDEKLNPLTSFISIDTNELDQHRLEYIPEGNRITISAFDKASAIEAYRRSNNPCALQWLDEAYQPRAGFKPGAGQIRIESRLGFFYYSSAIKQRLRELVLDALRSGITWRQSNPPKFNVYLYCTLAGGTGSGSFLSATYLIDEVIREQHWQPRIVANLLLSTLLTDKVGVELHADIHANTYAALKELEHLTKLDYKQVKEQGRKYEEFVFWHDKNRCGDPDQPRPIMTVDHRPFFLSFLFDQPAHLSLRDAADAIADASYMQIFTPIIGSMAGELDNYEKGLEELTHFPGELRSVGEGYAKHYGAYGASALVLPGHDLLEYCAHRFAAQAIREQITFGLDASNAVDDRARALARHAVNYADPKFLRMSDDAREAAINQAFVQSVRELARQDEREELEDGVWIRLVEGVDRGFVNGKNEQGEPIRGDSTIQRIDQVLAQQRRNVLNKLSIKERAFIFHKEGINQYVEFVSRLKEDLRRAREVADEATTGLEASAAEGEAIIDLKLDPIHERYLVLRLLDQCTGEWLPDAEQALAKATKQDITQDKIRRDLEEDQYQRLREAAERRRLFHRDREFLLVRDQAQENYRRVAAGSIRAIEAGIRVHQYKALERFLRERSRQYARLAVRMDSLVTQLEAGAGALLRGEDMLEPALALKVEVFETLTEPRTRIWDKVYHELFIARGKYINTLDRQVLAETITRELKPVILEDGTVSYKSTEQTAADMRRAFLALGRERLSGAITGNADAKGLDILSALQMEARIVLSEGRKPDNPPNQGDLDNYRERKFRALAQISGVFARIDQTSAESLDDGVKVNRTRLLAHGLDENTGGGASFVDHLKSTLTESGRQVKPVHWRNPHLMIVHDVEVPIPLYYFRAITPELENAYLAAAGDERRSYQLHTDFRWEKSLVNLNPRGAELSVDWSLLAMARGLRLDLIKRQEGHWVAEIGGKIDQLGRSFSETLYRLNEIHRHEDYRNLFDRALSDKAAASNPQALDGKQQEWLKKLEGYLGNISRHELSGEARREDVLDRPILRTMIRLMQKQIEEQATGGSLYDQGSVAS